MRFLSIKSQTTRAMYPLTGQRNQNKENIKKEKSCHCKKKEKVNEAKLRRYRFILHFRLYCYNQSERHAVFIF